MPTTRCAAHRLENFKARLDTLSFVGHSLQSHTASVIFPHVSDIVAILVDAIKDSFYKVNFCLSAMLFKVSAEALEVTHIFIKVLAENRAEAATVSAVEKINAAVLTRLVASDLDQVHLTQCDNILRR